MADHVHLTKNETKGMATSEHDWSNTRLTNIGNQIRNCPDGTCQKGIDDFKHDVADSRKRVRA